MLDQAQTSAALARRAVELAAAHGISPTPAVFEVLTRHLSGDEPELGAEVDAAFALSPARAEQALAAIHARSVGVDALRSELERVHRDLQGGISQASLALSNSIAGNLRLAGDLRKSLRDIADIATREDLQAVARHMVVAGRSHLQDTQEVSSQLERTQTQLTTMEAELSILRRQALTDALTGLPNRRAFDDRIDTLIAAGGVFSCAIVDLDRFKTVNDTWGHQTGDNILRGLGDLLKRNIRGRDFAGRMGGEEFALLLPDTGLAGAVTVAETIRKAFSEITWISQARSARIGTLTLSCGVSEFQPGEAAEELIERTDRLLYRAKEEGRNRVVSS